MWSLQSWLWRILSYGIQHSVVLWKWTDISEEYLTSISRVKKSQARNLHEASSVVYLLIFLGRLSGDLPVFLWSSLVGIFRFPGYNHKGSRVENAYLKYYCQLNNISLERRRKRLCVCVAVIYNTTDSTRQQKVTEPKKASGLDEAPCTSADVQC
jgi:hypothetical protein